MKKKTRFLSALLAMALCLGCMALPAFAEGEEDGTKKPLPDPPDRECTCIYNCTTLEDIEDGHTSDGSRCGFCYQYLILLSQSQYQLSRDEFLRIISDRCIGEGRYSGGNVSTNASVNIFAKRDFAPDVTGNYRTTATRLREKLDPVGIARQELYIDPVTNTIVNLYDADGNLITATLSSDGHFYIVPDSSGEFVYIPTGK